MGIVERIVIEIQRHAERLAELLQQPGQIIINVNPTNETHPVKIEIRAKM